MKTLLSALALATLPFPALAADSLQTQVSAVLAEAGPGTRWGVVVADVDGKEVVSIDPEGRYVPASNTKLYTTAAAFWKLGGIDAPDRDAGALVWPFPLKDKKGGVQIMLVGRGDARLSAADDCTIDCLSELANAIAAKTKHVSQVIGIDTHFPDERWSPGMSWNNIPTEDGTGISALSIDNNEAQIMVTAVKAGESPTVTAPA